MCRFDLVSATGGLWAMLGSLWADVVVERRPVLPWGWGFAELAIFIVIVAAVVALVYIALRQFGVAIPEWVRQACWVVAVAFVVILLIRLVASL